MQQFSSWGSLASSGAGAGRRADLILFPARTTNVRAASRDPAKCAVRIAPGGLLWRLSVLSRFAFAEGRVHREWEILVPIFSNSVLQPTAARGAPKQSPDRDSHDSTHHIAGFAAGTCFD